MAPSELSELGLIDKVFAMALFCIRIYIRYLQLDMTRFGT